MFFQKEKTTFLSKIDKSSQGFIDKDIITLINKINFLPPFFTTSSCSGRITLLNEQNKQKSKWLFKSHQPIKELKLKKDCWFMQEPIIIHVRCKDLDAANHLLQKAFQANLTKSSIISTKKLTIELLGTQRIETYLTKDLPKKYLKILIKKANQKLIKEKNKIKKLEELLDEKN